MHIPAELRDPLALVQGFHPNAFIGGGALRDLYLDRPIKDVDIFVQATENRDLHDHLIGLGYRRTAFADSQYLGGDLECLRASEYALGFGIPINIVELVSFRSLPAALDRHDFGLCQIGFHGGEAVVVTNGFFHDVQLKHLTLRRCESQTQFDRSMIRAERLLKKYPEFQLVIPDEFADFRQRTFDLEPF